MTWWQAGLALLATFLAGALAGLTAANLRSGTRRPVALENPASVWRTLTEHEISFLRRVWRVGFILEEDETLWRDARPERVNATLHGLVDHRRLVYVDRVRGSAQRLRAYRLTAAGKNLMTWVTNAGK